MSDYGLQLREKQKVKRMYGLAENQFKLTYKRAAGMRGVTGHNLLLLLETRLDNVVYRLGLANSRNQARQLVRHGHITVNGNRVNIPSARLKVGDSIGVREKSRENEQIKQGHRGRGPAQCAGLAGDGAQGDDWRPKGPGPLREELTMPMQEQLIVELYSR